MNKYKVLKSFPSSDGGVIHNEGDTYKPTQSATRTRNLERLGYIERTPRQPKTVWDLKEGDDCYHINNDGSIAHIVWCNTAWSMGMRDMGNAFLTEEEAKKELAHRKVKAILERDTKGFKPDWGKPNATEDKWIYTIYYSHRICQLVCNGYAVNQFPCDIWFTTEEDAEASIKAHEKEWKIYLGVENEDN